MTHNSTPADELADKLEVLSQKATPAPWGEAWKVDYLNDGWGAMQACGPQTMALKLDDARFQELVAEQAFADASLITELVNNLPAIIAAIRAVAQDNHIKGQDNAG